MSELPIVRRGGKHHRASSPQPKDTRSAALACYVDDETSTTAALLQPGVIQSLLGGQAISARGHKVPDEKPLPFYQCRTAGTRQREGCHNPTRELRRQAISLHKQFNAQFKSPGRRICNRGAEYARIRPGDEVGVGSRLEYFRDEIFSLGPTSPLDGGSSHSHWLQSHSLLYFAATPPLLKRGCLSRRKGTPIFSSP